MDFEKCKLTLIDISVIRGHAPSKIALIEIVDSFSNEQFLNWQRKKFSSSENLGF